MQSSRRIVVIFVAILALLLISSPFIAFSNSASSTVDAGAFTSASAAAEYGDLLQYEWDWWAYDSESTKASPGPAPDRPDFLWEIPWNESVSNKYVEAWDGKVFVAVGGGFGFPPPPSYLYCLEAFTGDIIYKVDMPAGPSAFQGGAFRLDEEYLMVVGGRELMCFRTEDGALMWIEPGQFAPLYWPANYDIRTKRLYTIDMGGGAFDEQAVRCYDLSDPSQPPSILWNASLPIYYELLASGDGKLFLGSREFAVTALDSETGAQVWKTEIDQMTGFSGTLYRGKLLAGCLADSLFCFDAETGTIEWEYLYGPGGSSASQGGCAAYGMYYEKYVDFYGTHFSAWNVETGEKEWDYYRTGIGGIVDVGGYVQPVVADGKVYSSFPKAADDPDPYYSRFVCWDAFSGEKLWEIPLDNGQPTIAYGNLYGAGGSPRNSRSVFCIGPAKPWSMWRGNIENPGIAVGQSGPTNLYLRWKYKTDAAVTSSPAVVDGKVYIGSHDKNIYCLDARKGTLIWKFPTDYMVLSSPAVVDGKVYTGADDGYIHCIDAETGTELWKTKAMNETLGLDFVFMPTAQFRSSPIIVDDKLYVGAIDGTVYCLYTNGTIDWTYKTEGRIGGSPLYFNDTVYIEASHGVIYALDATTGTHIWNSTMPGSFLGLSAEGSLAVGAEEGLIYAGDAVLFAGTQGLQAFNATTGNLTWTAAVYGGGFETHAPLYVDGTVFLQGKGGVIHLFDATNGTDIWTGWVTPHEYFSSAAYADGKIYFGSETYCLFVVNHTDGQKLAWFQAKGQVESSPAIWEGKVYFGSADFNVYCLDDFPQISTSITAYLSKTTISEGESVNVSGQLTPPIAYAPITVRFFRPDDTTVDLQVDTDEKGVFTVPYTPDVDGQWTAWAYFDPHKDQYTYAWSEEMSLTVLPSAPSPSAPQSYAIGSVLAIAVVAAATIAIKKKPKLR